MFLIDTNIISEGRKLSSGKANPGVVVWLAQADPSSAFISAMTLYELERGILGMERRDEQQGRILRQWLTETILPGFEGRILPMTAEIGIRCASLHIPDPRSERDTWIAATALVHELAVVTRNIADFDGTGVALVNPWGEQS